MEDGIEGVQRAFVFDSFERFIRVFLAVSDCLQGAEDFANAVVALASRLAHQGVTHAEITVTAATHVRRGVSITALLEGLADGRASAQSLHGVAVTYVFDVVCMFPDQADATVSMALEGRAAGVRGLGLAGPEARSAPIEAFVPAFDRAAAKGLRCVPHAGEHAGAERVRAVVERLHATRIGHGVRCLEDPGVVKLLRDRGVVLEVCPTSNIALGVAASWATHPLPRLLDASLEVVIASDDPALFGTSVVHELVQGARAFGWDRARVRQLCEASVRAVG